MNLKAANIGDCRVIDDIQANEEGMKDFLFTLGCFPGEPITLISRMASNYIINIKDARYSIDSDLASAIILRNPDKASAEIHATQAV